MADDEEDEQSDEEASDGEERDDGQEDHPADDGVDEGDDDEADDDEASLPPTPIRVLEDHGLVGSLTLDLDLLLSECRRRLEAEEIVGEHDLFLDPSRIVPQPNESKIKLADIVVKKKSGKTVESIDLLLVSRVLIPVVRAGDKVHTLTVETEHIAGRRLDRTREELGEKMRESDLFQVGGSPLPKEEESAQLLRKSLDEAGRLQIQPAKAAPVADLPAADLTEISDADKPSTERLEAELLAAPERSIFDVPAADDARVNDPLALTREQQRRLIRENRLLHGFDVSTDQPRKSDHEAFAFVDDGSAAFVLQRDDTTEIRSETTDSERSKNFVETGFAKGEAKLKTPWVSGSAGGSYQERDAGAEKSKVFYATGRWRVSRAVVYLDPSGFRATEAFQQAAEKALKLPGTQNQFVALVRVFQKFGQIIPTKVTLGGELIYTKYSTSESEVSEHELEWEAKAAVAVKVRKFLSADASAGGGQHASAGETDQSMEQDEQLTARGGNTLCASAPGSWLASVGSWEYWRPIAFAQPIPTYLALDESVRDAVISVLNRQLRLMIGSIAAFSIAPTGDFYAVSARDRRLWRFNHEIQMWRPISAIATASVISVAALLDGSAIVTAYYSASGGQSSQDKAGLFHYLPQSEKPMKELTLPGDQFEFVAPFRGLFGFTSGDIDSSGKVCTLRQLVRSGDDYVPIRSTKYAFNDSSLGHGERTDMLSLASFDDGSIVILLGRVQNSDDPDADPAKTVDRRHRIVVFDGTAWRAVNNSSSDPMMCISAGPGDILIGVRAADDRGASAWEEANRNVFSAANEGWASADFCYSVNWRETIYDEGAEKGATVEWKPLDPTALLSFY